MTVSFPAANNPFVLYNTSNYLWAEVDDPVELDDEAGLSLLKTKVWVVQAGAGAQPGPGEAAGLPDAHIALQVASVLVLYCFLWRRGGRGNG